MLRTKPGEKGAKDSVGAGEHNPPGGIAGTSGKPVEPEIKPEDIVLLEVCI